MLILGTAQFGSAYGVVNSRGQVSLAEIAEILTLARQSGVDRIDTAPAYGEAEQMLRRCGVGDFKVITKIPALEQAGHCNFNSAVIDIARRSCGNLDCDRLHGLLLHSASDLTGSDGDKVYAGLKAAKQAGLVEQIGVSVYSAGEIETIVRRYPVDIVQLPLSVLDQRLCEWLPRLADRGVAVHVRSIFLQGLLLCSEDKVPNGLAPLAPAIAAFRRRAENLGMQAIEAAVAFVRDLPHINGIVVGVTGASEFRALLGAFSVKATFDADGLAVTKPDLIDPRRWVIA